MPGYPPDPAARASELIDREYPSLEMLYREFHSHPELSGQEQWTSGRLARELREAGCEVIRDIGGTGIAALLRNGNGPVLMIRADMDALPIREETGLPWQSRVTTVDSRGREVGVMHACGHDLHMTALVGAARALSALASSWRGTLLLIGQPSEESVSGAARMIADGLYTRIARPDAAIALHVAPDLPAGCVGYREGLISAGGESLDMVVRGIGGHAAHPETTRDPVVLAAQIILALQTIVSREIAAPEMAILTVAAVHGGSKHNAIPDEVVLQVNVRYFKPEIRDHLLTAIRRVADGIARAAGLPPDRLPKITILPESVPPVENDPGLTGRVAGAFLRSFGPDRVTKIDPATGSEDFGIFGKVDPPVPICYFRVGCGDSGGFLHSSMFAPDPAVIRDASHALVIAALEILAPGGPSQEREGR
ncbi:MAG: amidohydrolase [Methanomicrobiales archaeon]|nr:amidohydrolase [Methanomicrobiales archaeon]